MKPVAFEYYAPNSIAEVLHLLNEHGFDAKILAGGQSLVPAMNFRLAQPAVLVDINRIAELSYIQRTGSGFLQIGALTRHAELGKHQLVAEISPLITETMPHVAHPQIRNRGTIGGSLVHADPAAELPAIMIALNAEFTLQSEDGRRTIAARDFFVDLFMTQIEAEELLLQVDVPALPARTGFAFKEVARRHGDFALVGVAAVVTLDADDKCEEARIVLLNVGNGPVQAHAAAACLRGEPNNFKRLEEAAQIASAQDIDPPSDMHASADFRRHLIRVLVRQALARAFSRASAKE